MLQIHDNAPTPSTSQTQPGVVAHAADADPKERASDRLPWSPPRLIRLATADGVEKNASAEEGSTMGPS